MAWWLFATGLAVFRSSNTQLDVLTARDALSDLTSAEPNCEKTLEEITDGKVDKTLPALLRRHCASSDVIQKKEKCAGVTRLTEEALGSSEPSSSGAACQRLEKFFLFVARDLQALNVSSPGDTHCMQSVAAMTGTREPLPKQNFTQALAKGCTVSCKEVVKMSNRVLSEDRLPAADEAAVTPKLYCKLHDDYLDDIGIYDVDGLFALVFGHAEGPSTKSSVATASGKEYPKALQVTRDENAKVFEILASEPEKPHSVSLAGAAVLGLIFLLH
jgi:hypothetical protein